MVSLGNISGFIIDKIKSITNFQNNHIESPQKVSTSVLERLKNYPSKQLHNTLNIKNKIIAWIDSKRGPSIGDKPETYLKIFLDNNLERNKRIQFLENNISIFSQKSVSEGINKKLLSLGIGIREGQVVDLLKELGINKDTWILNIPQELKELLQKGEFNEKAFEGEKLGAGNFGTVYSVGKDGKCVVKISHNTVDDPNEDEDKIGNNLVMSKIKGRDTEGVYVKGVDFITKHYGGMSVRVGNDVKYLNIFQRADGKSGDKFFESAEFKNMPWQKRNDILIQFAKAVNTLHSVGLVHQDLKPENLQIHYDKDTGKISVKVMDFGTAGTRTESSQGSPMFYKGNDSVGFQKDVNAFGATMLFNFFPNSKKTLELFLTGLNSGVAMANQSEWGSVLNNGIIELKEGLTNKGSQYTSKDKFLEYIDKKSKESNDGTVKVPYFSDKFNVNLDKLLNYAISQEVIKDENGKESVYNTQEKTFLNAFFKQTLSRKPPSMEQIVGALEAFNGGGISAEGIFDKSTPKRIPEYLLNAVEKAKDFDIQDKEAHKAFIAKVDELTDFIEQNPDYVSDKDKDRFNQLGLFIPNQAEF